MRKHIYDEDDRLVFPEEKSSKYADMLYDVLYDELKKLSEEDLDNVMCNQRFKMCDVSREIVHTYLVYESLDGVSDISLDKFRNMETEDEFFNVTKEIFFDYLNDKWVLHEFSLLMWNIVCQTQINIIGI